MQASAGCRAPVMCEIDILQIQAGNIPDNVNG